jgi:hypothetical protein
MYKMMRKEGLEIDEENQNGVTDKAIKKYLNDEAKFV